MIQGLAQQKAALLNNTAEKQLAESTEAAKLTRAAKAATQLPTVDILNDTADGSTSISANISASISTEAQQKLAHLREAQTLAQAVPEEDTSERQARVAQLKALAANGGIAGYLKQLDSAKLADAILKHPLQPHIA